MLFFEVFNITNYIFKSWRNLVKVSIRIEGT